MRVLKFFLFTLIFLVIVLEIFLRFFFYEQLKTRKMPNVFEPDSMYSVRYIPNATGHIVSPGVDHIFKINKEGFLGPDFSRNNTGKKFKIIVVGNSNVTGIHMNSENTFCIQLQKIFDKYGLDIEIINCSLNGGHKDIQNLMLISHEIVKYNPNLILFEAPDGLFEKRNYVFDQYDDYNLEYDPRVPGSRETCIKRVDIIKRRWYLTMFYDASYIIRAMCKKYIDNQNSTWSTDQMLKRNDPAEIYLYTYIAKESKAPTVTYFYTYEKAVEEMNKVKLKLKAINCNFCLFTYGFFDNDLQEVYKMEGIDYIQLKLGDYFRLFPVTSKLEGHFNELGHAFIAERLFSQLVTNNYIPINNNSK